MPRCDWNAWYSNWNSTVEEVKSLSRDFVKFLKITETILPIFNLLTKAATSLRKSEKFSEICQIILAQGFGQFIITTTHKRPNYDQISEYQKQKKARALDRINQKQATKSENENAFKLQYLKAFVKSESGESANAAILDLIEKIKVCLFWNFKMQKK